MDSAAARIDERLATWLCAQKMFFVATAPLAASGHVNCSPKGLDAFRVVDPRTVAYVDLTGSGAETVAHVRENGRIVLMFCAFEGPPRIVRLHGRGEIVTPASASFDSLSQALPWRDGARSIVCVHVTRVAESCGFGVPQMAFRAERETLDEWSRRKGARALAAYRRKHNAQSIDGLPAIDID